MGQHKSRGGPTAASPRYHVTVSQARRQSSTAALHQMARSSNQSSPVTTQQHARRRATLRDVGNHFQSGCCLRGRLLPSAGEGLLEAQDAFEALELRSAPAQGRRTKELKHHAQQALQNPTEPKHILQHVRQQGVYRVLAEEDSPPDL